MRKVILILTLLLSIQSFGQMLKDIKEPELYVEPPSIQSVNQVWQSDVSHKSKVGITMVIGGVTMIGLDMYEEKEPLKVPTNNGWIYRPFMIVGTKKNNLLNK